jgi:3-deoxy-D-arabino-heptulosonate 7-phosphate (DAHP) synthase
MKLHCLNTGSEANGYILQASNGDSLILEAGVRAIEMKKSLNFDISKIQGLLLSHQHL